MANKNKTPNLGGTENLSPDQIAQQQIDLAATKDALDKQAAVKDLQTRRDFEDKQLQAAQELAEQARNEISPSKAEYKRIIEEYKKQNPVKYELKKDFFAKRLASL
jgi:hypothetical protein